MFLVVPYLHSQKVCFFIGIAFDHEDLSLDPKNDMVQESVGQIENLDNVDNMINVAAFCSLYSPQACWDQTIHGFDIVKHRRKSMASHLQTLQGAHDKLQNSM